MIHGECIFYFYFVIINPIYLIPIVFYHFFKSGDDFPEFQSQGRSHHSHASLSALDGILRFMSGAIPANFLAASQSMPKCTKLLIFQAVVGLKPVP